MMLTTLISPGRACHYVPISTERLKDTYYQSKSDCAILHSITGRLEDTYDQSCYRMKNLYGQLAIMGGEVMKCPFTLNVLKDTCDHSCY